MKTDSHHVRKAGLLRSSKDHSAAGIAERCGTYPMPWAWSARRSVLAGPQARQGDGDALDVDRVRDLARACTCKPGVSTVQSSTGCTLLAVVVELGHAPFPKGEFAGCLIGQAPTDVLGDVVGERRAQVVRQVLHGGRHNLGDETTSW